MSVSARVNERLAALTEAGTSVWLDQIRRSLIEGGELQRLIDEDSLRGVTSNPAIFEKAILGSDDYDDELARAGRGGADAARDLRARSRSSDVQLAADVLRPVYDEPDGHDGFVSLEVMPDLAHDTDGDARAGARLLAARRPPEPDDQDPRHRRGRAGDRGRRSPRASTSTSRCCSRSSAYAQRRRGLHPRPRAPPRRGRVARRALGRELLRLARRHRGRQAARASAAAPTSQGTRRRSPTRAPPTCASRRSSAATASPSCATAGAPVQRPLWASTGVKNPHYPRHDVRRRARRARHRQHDADAHAARGGRARRDQRPTADVPPRTSTRELAALRDAGIDLDDVTDKLLRRRRRAVRARDGQAARGRRGRSARRS